MPRFQPGLCPLGPVCASGTITSSSEPRGFHLYKAHWEMRMKMSIYTMHLDHKGPRLGMDRDCEAAPAPASCPPFSGLLCDLRTLLIVVFRERSHGEAKRMARKQPGWDWGLSMRLFSALLEMPGQRCSSGRPNTQGKGMGQLPQN